MGPARRGRPRSRPSPGWPRRAPGRGGRRASACRPARSWGVVILSRTLTGQCSWTIRLKASERVG
ncbi:hypothetical protein BRD56_12290 [Thermoplasmatales archaeon SW_10_69_26]|nr:MAG: hypothetical protein BRD56_12290 [Thermoplasmatales archaeon SW_10_69_26]